MAASISKKKPKLTQAEKSAETQRKILDATIDCLCNYGVQNTTLARIARHAELTWGAVQHHFPGKVDVFQAAAAREFERFEKEFHGIALKDKELFKRISEFIDIAWNIYSRPSYRAMLELLITLRLGDELYDEVFQITQRISRSTGRTWMELFKDTGITSKEHQQARGIVFTSLRGLAVALFHGDESDTLDEIVEGLKQAVYAFVSSRSGY
jgi:AcrR family transcriptional regulator